MNIYYRLYIAFLDQFLIQREIRLSESMLFTERSVSYEHLNHYRKMKTFRLNGNAFQWKLFTVNKSYCSSLFLLLIRRYVGKSEWIKLTLNTHLYFCIACYLLLRLCEYWWSHLCPITYAWNCKVLFQVEAFRIQNLQIMLVETSCIPVQNAPLKSRLILVSSNFTYVTSKFCTFI